MKCKQASLVINPRAGQNIAKIPDILAILAAAGWSTNLALKEYGGQATTLAAKAVEEGSDLVIAYGGDGTLNHVVNGVMRAKQQSIIGVIPGGTVNVWASEIQVPCDSVNAALTLVDSNTRKVDIGHVEVEGLTFLDVLQDDLQQHEKKPRKKQGKVISKGRQHFLLMAGLGIDAAVMGHVSRPLKYRIGPLAVGVAAAKEVLTQHPFPVEIRVNDASNAEMLWKGEALQVVIGNTRRYANIVEMTPNAYIDDGMLDVCIITAGDPLTTMEQIISLLGRRKPDTLTAEYFHGAHLSITVPASIAMQLDGSAVKLKDYLNKPDRKALAQASNKEQVMVTYRFDALPKALKVAMPRSYDNALFEASDSANHQQPEKPQVVTEQETSQEIQQQEEKDHKKHRHTDNLDKDEQQKNLKLVNVLLEHGREVTVVGISSNPAQKGTYIVAGSTLKQSTGEIRPVAVCIDKSATLRGQTGEVLSPEIVPNLQKGQTIVVEGKKSKRGVIWAKQVVI
jgi:YegS/Rv2252/BmrU family lipid kinase